MCFERDLSEQMTVTYANDYVCGVEIFICNILQQEVYLF